MSSNTMKSEEEIGRSINTAANEAGAVRPGLEFPIAESHFDQDIEGWSIIGDGGLAYSATGGHPGGCLKATDFQDDSVYYFVAPEKFLGPKLGATRLDYDIKWVSSFPVFEDAEIILVRGDTVLRYDTTLPPRNVWVHYSVPLAAGDGWTNVNENRPATAHDFKFVLSSLEQIKIRGEFGRGLDFAFLDNVVMYFVKSPPSLRPVS